jgi:hypothetical protein
MFIIIINVLSWACKLKLNPKLKIERHKTKTQYMLEDD